MVEIKVELLDYIYEKLHGISKILNISFNKVINVSLLKGFSRYWKPITKAVSEYPEWDLPKSEKDKKIQDIWDSMAEKLELEYNNLKELESLENEFNKIYPLGYFKNPEERNKEFVRFLESTSD